jgi:alanyl-tRNA synthetase
MAAENGMTVDFPAFRLAMEEQKDRSRRDARTKRLSGRVDLSLGAEQTDILQKSGVRPTEDAAKYEWDTTVNTEVMALFTAEGLVRSVAAGTETVGVVLRASPFYAEAGGQECDTGVLTATTAKGDRLELEVLDVQVNIFLKLKMLVSIHPQFSPHLQ